MKTEHWLLPADATPEEKEIVVIGIGGIYSQFNDPMDQLIIAMVFELGYPRTMVAEITGRTPKTIWLRIKKIQTILSTSHKSYLKPEIKS